MTTRNKPLSNGEIEPTPSTVDPYLSVQIEVRFDDVRQVELFERLLKRITPHDLHGLMFSTSDVHNVLSVLGQLRAPLKHVLAYCARDNTTTRQ